jgi:hypothetical protein
MEFFYSSPWRMWLTYSESFPNSRAHLWSIFLEKQSGLEVIGANTRTNRLGNALAVRKCNTCKTPTPHDYLGGGLYRCRPCQRQPLLLEDVAKIENMASNISDLKTKGGQSILNTIKHIEGSDRNYDYTGVNSSIRDLHLFLGGIVVLHNAEKQNGICDKAQVKAWIAQVFELTEFELELDVLVGRIIGSLCSRGAMDSKDGRYKLKEQSAPGQ